MIKCKNIHMSEWNELFSTSLKYRVKVFKEYDKKVNYLGSKVYIWIGKSHAYCYFADIAKNTSKFYRTSIDVCNDDKDVRASGGAALMSLVKSIPNGREIIHLHDKDSAALTAQAILWYNKDLTGHRYDNCIGYDRNSAFPWGMLQDMPDTSHPLGPGIVEPGQVGFFLDGGAGEMMVFEGYATKRFPLMPSPFKPFVDKWYGKKKKARTKENKQYAKNMLNYAIGNLQNCNCYLRAAIIEYSNQFMLRIINKYPDIVLFSNTDSIVSLERIPELDAEIGNEIGQWKIEHKGDFAFKGLQYQWNYNDNMEITYRGIPKVWFKNYEKNYGKKFDILTCELPQQGNNYYISEEGMICPKEEIKNLE